MLVWFSRSFNLQVKPSRQGVQSQDWNELARDPRRAHPAPTTQSAAQRSPEANAGVGQPWRHKLLAGRFTHPSQIHLLKVTTSQALDPALDIPKGYLTHALHQLSCCWPIYKGTRVNFKQLKVKVAQSCPTLCDPMDYTVHGILQARILEWVAFPFSRGSSQPRDRTQVSCIARRFYTSRATGEAPSRWRQCSVSTLNICTSKKMSHPQVLLAEKRGGHNFKGWLGPFCGWICFHLITGNGQLREVGQGWTWGDREVLPVLCSPQQDTWILGWQRQSCTQCSLSQAGFEFLRRY